MKALTIGVAALALAAGGALSAQGRGHGGGGGHGNGGDARAMAGGGGHGRQAAGSMQATMQGRGPAMRASGQANGHGHGRAMRASADANGHAHGRAMARADAPVRARDHGHAGKVNGQGRAMAARGDGKPAKAPPGLAAGGPGKPENAPGVQLLADGRHYYAQRGVRPAFDFAPARRGLINGCPPGLAKKADGCMPPGLARQAAWRPDWWGLNGLSGSYYYRDGYLVRLGGNAVVGYVPLLGGALSIGNPWPTYYEPVPVPAYYVDYYDLGPPGGYRYADNVLYRIDPTTLAIASIAGLLTGNDIRIGSPMPPGYDIYNVPYDYRARYPDGPNAWYRYSDGYIYQVDPTTGLVTAAIEAIAT